jgi:hypothetical protein
MELSGSAFRFRQMEIELVGEKGGGCGHSLHRNTVSVFLWSVLLKIIDCR